MADGEFDGQAANTQLREYAESVQPIRDRLTEIINFYYEKVPTSPGDAEEYRVGIREKLTAVRDSLNSLINGL